MPKQITMVELHNQFGKIRKNELILDVRGKDEYLEGHVPGSKNIPYDEVEKHVNELKTLEQVYVHCRSGGRAQIACQTLEKFGLKNLVCVVGSGMKDWIAAGFSVEKQV